MSDSASWIILGDVALTAGLVFSLGAVAVALYGGLRGERRAVSSAERSLIAASALAWVAAACLVALMLARDYRVAYAWEYTSNTLPVSYTVTALWAGQAGSLLWWLCLLGAVVTVAARTTLRRDERFRAGGLVVLGAITAFFFVLVQFAADPFQLLVEKYPDALGHRPVEGQGLNPQLQNFGMIIHPPLLYLGYILFSVPFALALASLAGNLPHGDWVRRARPWTLSAWILLGFGILCGMKWAYVELGWGGYWAWDPVENASLLPWLTGTALLHSAMVEERMGALRRWNYLLAILTFLLSVFGTFLTRSGILSSVHAFAQSDVGPYFLNFFAAWSVIGLGLLAWRWKLLVPRRAIPGIWSREALFLFQNLLLVGLAAAVFWGTMYPIVSEKVTGETVTVASPYYGQVAVPLGLVVYLLMGAAPLLPWRGSTPRRLLRLATLPGFVGLFAGATQLLAFGGSLFAAAGTALAFFVLAVLALDLVLSARSIAARDSMRAAGTENVATGRRRRLAALGRLVDRQHRRYGGFVAHAGMAVLLIGFAGAGFNREVEGRLAVGERLDLAPWSLELVGASQGHDGHRDFVRADLKLHENGITIDRLLPEISIYFAGQEREQRNTEVAIRSSPVRDLYVIFVEPDGGHAVIRLMVQPLVLAVWAGGLLVLLGAVLALLPDGIFEHAFRRDSNPAISDALCPSCGASGRDERHCWNCGVEAKRP